MSKYKKTSRVAIAAAAVLALSFSALAHAAGPDLPPPPPGDHHGPGPHGPHGHGPHGGPFGVFKRLHDKLKLTPEQEQQWQAANATAKQNFETAHKNREAARAQFEAAQNQPIIDLDALHAAHQQAEQQDAQLREQTEKGFLAFYDSLNDQQKTEVSTALKADFAKMKARHEKFRKQWEKHHHAAKPAPASAPAQ